MTPNEQKLLYSLSDRVTLLEKLVNKVEGIPHKCKDCRELWWQRTLEAFKRKCPKCSSENIEDI